MIEMLQIWVHIHIIVHVVDFEVNKRHAVIQTRHTLLIVPVGLPEKKWHHKSSSVVSRSLRLGSYTLDELIFNSVRSLSMQTIRLPREGALGFLIHG